MDNNTLYPIYGTWHVPFWQTRWFYATVAILGIALLALIVWFVVKKLRTPKQKAKPAWVVAFAELDAIQTQLAQKGMLSKTFYFRLTWLFKRYLSGRYGFDVYGKTDKELLMFLEGAGLAPDLVQDLGVIFEGSSVVKFANEQALKERMKKDLVLSREFIKKTMPTEEDKKNKM